MKARRFFAVLWRANALLIFVAGALGSVVLVFALVLIYGETTRTQHASDVLNVADEEINRSKASLSDFDTIEGSPVLRAKLVVEQEYAFSSGMKETHSIQNYLHFDPTKNLSYWLIPGFKGLILSTYELPEHDYKKPSTPVRAILYALVERDSNGDGKLTENDAKEIAVSDPAGTRLTRVLKDVEEFNGGHLLDSTSEALLFYTSAGSLRTARVDLGTGKLLNDSLLKPLK